MFYYVSYYSHIINDDINSLIELDGNDGKVKQNSVINHSLKLILPENRRNSVLPSQIRINIITRTIRIGDSNSEIR